MVGLVSEYQNSIRQPPDRCGNWTQPANVAKRAQLGDDPYLTLASAHAANEAGALPTGLPTQNYEAVAAGRGGPPNQLARRAKRVLGASIFAQQQSAYSIDKEQSIVPVTS